MVQKLFDFIMGIPATLGEFSNWLTSPIHSTYLNISPIELLGVAGVTTIIVLIGVHVVKLFI